MSYPPTDPTRGPAPRFLAAAGVVLTLTASGCYLSHQPEPEHPTRDAGSPRRDSGVTPPRSDAGWVAAEYDAGPVLPEEEEPVFGPDERPSDHGDDWTPPPESEPDVCCELDAPIEVTPRGAQGGVPTVAWTGTSWSVLLQSHDPDGALPSASGFSLYHAIVDADVTTVESFHPVPGGGSSVIGDEWAVGRHAVLTRSWGSDVSTFGLLDATGTLTAWWATVPNERGDGAVARQPYGATWAVATSRDDRIEVRGFDSSTTERALHTIDAVAAEGAVGAEGLGSRVAVVWPSGGRLWLQSVVIGDGPIEERMDLGRVGVATDSALRTAAFRDAVAITHLDGDRAWLTLADPFERTQVRVDLGEARVSDRQVGVVGVSKLGVLGACIPVGPGPYGGASGRAAEGVAFQLISGDGTLLGDRVQIVDGLINIGGCAVAFYEDSFIVVWWRASGDRDYNSLWARRVRPRLPL